MSDIGWFMLMLMVLAVSMAATDIMKACPT